MPSGSSFWATRLLGFAYDQVDGGGEAVPVGGFLFELGTARGGERVELCLTPGFAFCPFGLDPALLLKAMKGGVKGALLHLQDFAGKLLNPLGDSPAVHWFKEEGFEDEEVEGALNEVAWFAHA
jgi:hypothetical protein